MAFIKNENGWALPTVLMVMLVVTLLGTALWQYSVAENLQVTKNEKQMQARYLARAGVEAVRDAWLDSSLGNKPTGKVETVYLMLDGTFQKESALSKEQIKSQTIGHVSATVSHDKGEWTITSIGEVDSVSQTVNATSTPLVYGHELEPPWYNEEDDNILPGPNTQTLSDFDENLMYHDEVRGVALVESKNTLQMQNDNDNNKVAYIAQHLFFQSAVDLRLYTDWWWVVPIDTYQGFMVASAETVVFNDRLDVRVGILSLSYGVLVLHVPEGLGVPGEKVRAAPGYEDMIDENATYGKVFFDHVYTDGALNSNLSNKAFYFKRKLDEDGNDTGVIIFDRNAFTNYHTSYTSLINDGDLIPAATEGEQALTRPRPEDCLVFFWN